MDTRKPNRFEYALLAIILLLFCALPLPYGGAYWQWMSIMLTLVFGIAAGIGTVYFVLWLGGLSIKPRRKVDHKQTGAKS